jgi:hypothetical protein
LPRQLKPLPIVTLEEFVKGQFFIAGGCVSAYSRLLFSNFGPLDPAIRYPDYVLTFRALLASGCAFVDEPLVHYRVHEASITQRESNTRESPRQDAARWAKDEVATAQECLRNYNVSARRGPVLRWRLARAIAQAQLDERSSNGSHLEAISCVVRAAGTGRFNMAGRLFQRDVLARK